jgi:hypothetical protein
VPEHTWGLPTIPDNAN